MSKKIFFKSDFFNNKKFLKLIKNHNYVLDFGCGTGTIQTNKKKIYLYDNNFEVQKYLKKKYKNLDNYHILRKPLFKRIEVVLFNSVIQYISEKEFIKISNKIIKNKINTIIFSDVTKFPRYIEALILFLNNPIKLLKPAKYLFCSEYLKYNYYFRSQDKLILRFIKHYNVRILENLNGNKLSRFTILFKIK